MKKRFLICSLLVLTIAASAQLPEENPAAQYRATSPRINDLVHTKLDVKFDYDKSYLYGKAWVTLKPHFYATDSLSLDAKGMAINKVAIVRGTTMDALH